MTQSVICRGRWASLRQLQGRRRVVEILVGWDRYHCTYSGFIKLSWLLNRRLLSSLNHVVWYTFHMAQKYKRFSSHTAVMSGHKSHHTVLRLPSHVQWDDQYCISTHHQLHWFCNHQFDILSWIATSSKNYGDISFMFHSCQTASLHCLLICLLFHPRSRLLLAFLNAICNDFHILNPGQSQDEEP